MSRTSGRGAPLCYISRTEHFSSAHRLHNPSLSEEDNRDIYGKCNHPHGHGHNYVVKATLRGAVDPRTGMVINLVTLKEAMRLVLEELDHRNIDLDVEHFRSGTPSTAENLSVYIFNKLNESLPLGLLFEVELQETVNNVAFYRGEYSDSS